MLGLGIAFEPAAGRWTGRGRVQIAREGAALLVRIDALTSRTRRFKTDIAAGVRAELRSLRPKWGPFAAAIRIETTPQSPRHDVDNVAKAVLDALTGLVFFDDSQIERLYVEKTPGERARITARFEPLAPEPRP